MHHSEHFFVNTYLCLCQQRKDAFGFRHNVQQHLNGGLRLMYAERATCEAAACGKTTLPLASTVPNAIKFFPFNHMCSGNSPESSNGWTVMQTYKLSIKRSRGHHHDTIPGKHLRTPALTDPDLLAME